MSTTYPLANSGALEHVRVMVTRAGKDAAPLRARLEAEGAQVIELPTLAIAPPDTTEPLDEVLRRVSGFDWIVFTSRNAIHAVFDRLVALGLPAEIAIRVAAIGPSTAAELEERGVRVSCRPAEATAGELAAALREQCIAGCRILIPAGDLARTELADGLRASGATVEVVTAYRTVQSLENRREALDALRSADVDVITLASPSALQNLVTMLGTDVGALQFVRLACIGPTTAAAVRELDLEPAAVACEQTLDGLVAAVVALYSPENAL